MRPSGFVATSALSSSFRASISALLAPHPWFDFYWRCSLEDAARGLDNRSYLLGRRERGVVLAVHFDDVSIFSTVGDLDPDELHAMLARPERLELHVRREEMDLLRPACAARLARVDRIRYYRLETPARSGAPAACRQVRAEDAPEVLEFFRAHYPETILSSWMLELPFVGVWEGGALVAAAGAIIVSEALRACHVGNFLTHPAHRGRGLARAAAGGLIELLGRRGITTFMLGVDETNLPARRVYESVGFVHLDTRDNAFLDAVSPSHTPGTRP